MHLARTSNARMLALLAVSVLSGCSSSSNASDAGASPSSDAATGGPTPSPSDLDLAAEQAKLAGNGTSTTSTANAKAATELFVQEDPTIDAGASAADNARAVADQVSAAVKSCASATVAHTSGSTTVGLTFASTCTIGGVPFSGGLTANVSKTGSSITIAFTFQDLSVNGMVLNGTASETTSNGTTFTSAIDVTEGSNKITFNGTLTLDSGGTGVTLTGSGTYVSGTITDSYTASSVHHTFGACYADSGTLSYGTQTTGKSGKSYTVSETITFSSSTPTTGQASATVGGTVTTVTLRAYGSCPPG